MTARMNMMSEATRPLLLLGLTVVFIGALLLVSGGGPKKAPGAVRRLPAGGAAPLVPGSAVDGYAARPAGDAPPATVIQDTRQTFWRLPLDLNAPPASPPKTKPG